MVLYGPNGAGKTSILEAVDVLSSLKSFREPLPKNLIKWGNSITHIEGQVQSILGRQKMAWGYHEKKGRLLQIDGKNIRDLPVWFQGLRSILFCPEQIDIIRGSPQIRRNFIDRAKFIAEPGYLDVVRKYLQVLKHKKELLKKDHIKSLEVLPWNLQLVDLATKIILGRHEILEELSVPFQEMHQNIAGSEVVSLQIHGLGRDTTDLKNYLTQLFNKVLPEEIRKHQILIGPHKDDLEILINNHPARKFASQGQTRSIVVALKLAELEAARLRGEKPLFLLDDLSSELDLERRKKLVQMLSERDGQVWISTTNPNFLGVLPPGRVAKFYVEDGKVEQKQ